MQCDTLIMKYWSTNVHQHPIALSQLPMIIPDVALAIFQKTSDLILLTFLHVACESCRGTSILPLSSQAPRMWLRCMKKKEQNKKEDVTTLHRHGWKGNFWSSDNFSAQWQPALWRLSSVASNNSSYPSFICPQAVSFVIWARVWFSPWILFWLGKFPKQWNLKFIIVQLQNTFLTHTFPCSFPSAWWGDISLLSRNALGTEVT